MTSAWIVAISLTKTYKKNKKRKKKRKNAKYRHTKFAWTVIIRLTKTYKKNKIKKEKKRRMPNIDTLNFSAQSKRKLDLFL